MYLSVLGYVLSGAALPEIIMEVDGPVDDLSSTRRCAKFRIREDFEGV